MFLQCVECSTPYPVVLGIPDLRIFPDPYIDKSADRKKGLKVASKLETLGLEDLIDYYYSITSVVPPKHSRLYKRGLMAAGPRSEATLASWRRSETGAQPGASLLEVGCGTGPLLVAASQHYDQVVGVDIAFRWLVVAKKRLAESGVDAPLFCACAEALPFPSQAFNCLAAESVIELVNDQRQALAEFHRVLKPAGRLFLATPNRFSIGPDPHTGIWSGSWLPDRVLAAIVRRQGGIPPKRRFLTEWSLKALVHQSGFQTHSIMLPEIPPEQRAHFGPVMNTVVALYHFARRTFLLRNLLRWVGPSFQLVALRNRASRGQT